MTIITTILIWLVSVAELIIFTIFSFLALILLLFTFAIADIFQDETGQQLYCKTSEAGVENCYMKEWSIVD